MHLQDILHYLSFHHDLGVKVTGKVDKELGEEKEDWKEKKEKKRK